MKDATRRRVAVVGSGIGGLSAAYLLGATHDVTLYERNDHLGMDAHGIDVEIEPGKTGRIDVPLRVFTESYYRNLTALYDHIGVDYKPENYSGSFTSSKGEYFFSYSNLLLGKLSLPYIGLTNPFNATFWRILRDIVYFLFVTPRHAFRPELANMTFREYLESERYSADFIERMIVPTMAGICTCSFASASDYPADIVLKYLVTRSMRGVRRAQGGAADVVARLASRCKRVLCSARVMHIGRKIDSKFIRICLEDGSSEEYDHVVISTQANQAVDILTRPESMPRSEQTVILPVHDKDDPAYTAHVAALCNCLRQFPYEKSKLVLHDDPALMPANRNAWTSVNFILSESKDNVMASIWMNSVQPSLGSNRQFFQTWNPLFRPKNESILCEAMFERPVVTRDSVNAMKDLDTLQGRHNIWVCGSYVTHGVPLLETAVTSALRVSEALGGKCPWQSSLLITCDEQEKQQRAKAGHWQFAMRAFTFLTLCSVVFLIVNVSL